MATTRAPRNFAVLAVRRRGFEVTRSPAPASVAAVSLAPQIFDISGGGGPNTPLISWSAPVQNEDNSTLTDLAYFYVYRSQTNNFSTASRIAVVLAGTTSYTEPNAPSGTTYYWVTAIDSEGTESDPSNVITRTFS